jgi:hypothetical protein
MRRKTLAELIAEKVGGIKSKLDSAEWDHVDNKSIDEFIRQLEGYSAYEESRIERVESKATTILSASGIIATFVFAIVSIYQKWPAAFNRAILIFASILLIVAIALLLLTITWCFQVIGIRNYQYPTSINSIVDGIGDEIFRIKKERLVDLIQSLTANSIVINKKVDKLRISQTLFYCAITLVIADAALTIIYSIYQLWR